MTSFFNPPSPTTGAAPPSFLPPGFVFLSQVDPTLLESVRYATDENFMGRPVKGYLVPRIICTQQAAACLKEAHTFFKSLGYRVVVYDGYRPYTAVRDFIQWSQDPTQVSARACYYPTLEKEDIFRRGFVARENPPHSRGSTFDLTLISLHHSLQPVRYSLRHLANGEEIPFLDDHTVDMGSSFDLFHSASHHDSPLISPAQLALRNLLRQGMETHGFQAVQGEWWHYTLRDEPFPDTYFDFIVEA